MSTSLHFARQIRRHNHPRLRRRPGLELVVDCRPLQRRRRRQSPQKRIRNRGEDLPELL